MTRIVVVVSGGIDSVTMAHQLAAQGHRLHLLAVDYGQRHRKELGFARATAERLGAPYEEVDLTAVGRLLRGSSLTDPAVPVPDAQQAPSGPNPNIVPNRNALLLAVAYSVAVVERARAVAFGAMADDVGPSDTSPAFLAAFLAMERIATFGQAVPGLELLAPLITLHKPEVILRGVELGVPWQETWTCFRGGELHCGGCAACVERRTAFAAAAVKDPTEYRREPAASRGEGRRPQERPEADAAPPSRETAL
ncbi:7-cyano-7-deazaguanine synthase [Actinacidiphila sp. ITFR-21]|uniref:7-cyano-7-deazaguanine synthase n=1 Tax=Actinacidiphila sp. ITFR-21 TaxID=3075199 RepID=UPI00288A66EC|nr:7-cyano-7-deazaguanine synthase [Streptomyces sp. ITFR-21]WNI16406.1 7-cyano-7-deazaguanine synthase [Streptomyces sp. ITFR-21]